MYYCKDFYIHMSTKVNGISQEELRLRYAQTANFRATQNPGVNGVQVPKTAGVNPAETTTIDVNRINEVARKYAQRPETAAAAATTSNLPVKFGTSYTQELPKVDKQTAINSKSGIKTELPSALSFNAKVASNLYTNTADKFKDVGAYTQLSNIKLSDNNNTSKAKATNPFAGEYTGLSFHYSPDDIIA